jgi:hypothetical protein
MAEDRYWCSEGCGFCKESHRCEQWGQAFKIPEAAYEAISEEAIDDRNHQEFRAELWKYVAGLWDRWDKSHGTPGAWSDIVEATKNADKADPGPVRLLISKTLLDPDDYKPVGIKKCEFCKQVHKMPQEVQFSPKDMESFRAFLEGRCLNHDLVVELACAFAAGLCLD